MNPLTVKFIIVSVAAIVLYDCYALMKFGYNGTISHILLTAAKQWPIIAFAIGVVAGHLFWPNR